MNIILEGRDIPDDIRELLEVELGAFAFEDVSSHLATQVQHCVNNLMESLTQENRLSYHKVSACANLVKGTITVDLAIKGPRERLIRKIRMNVGP